LGPDVPLHFTAFHPDWKMLDKARTPAATLTRAREIARKNGLQHVYTGNVHDPAGSSTYCASCGTRVIERDWYELGEWRRGGPGMSRVAAGGGGGSSPVFSRARRARGVPGACP